MAWVDQLLRKMVEIKASDVHLSSQQKPRFRLHGDMIDAEGHTPVDAETLKNHLFEIAPDRNKKQFEAECDTDFAYEIKGAGRFRCNFFMDRYGPGGVFRHIPEETITIEQLNLPKAIVDLCHLNKGLVLVTGPTGSGKSTTLSAMIDYMNKVRREHIITIEDPIEFVHESKNCHINQREVFRHTESFKRALRAALREDPDIVLVGEMRDLETVEIAIETAETGHLVLATLHTNTAASTVDRVIDQFPANRQQQIRTMLAASLRGVISQTLCKKIGKGRVAALEVLIMNAAIANHIREGKTHQIVSAIQTGGKLGMFMLNDSLMTHVHNKVIEPMEAYIKSVDKVDMLKRLQTAGHQIDLSKQLEV